MKKLFLIDAYAMIFRAYYALLRNARYTTDGINTSAIFGFVNTLEDLFKKENPTHVAVCFDPAGGTFRHKEYPEYKAQREATPEDIKIAVPYIKEIIAGYNIPVVEVEGYEADDVIATLAKQGEAQGFEVYMMTPDKDFGQLVTEHIKMYKPPYGGGEAEVLGIAEVCAKHGITSPKQVIDILALQGDTADNIPGCPGVGKVTAAKLVNQFGSVEALLEGTDQLKGAIKTKVESNVEQIKMSKYLATICTEVPVTFDEEALRRAPINKEALRKVFTRLEFRALAKRVLGDSDDAESSSETATAPTLVLATEINSPLAILPMEKTAPKKPRQLSLFAEFDEPEEEEKEETPIAESNDCDIVSAAIREGKFGFAIISDSAEAMRANASMVAIATASMTACIPFDSEEVKRLFTSNAVKIGDDIKRAIIMLRRKGIELAEPYFDTAVAHYLLQPEQPHDYKILAENILSVNVPNDTPAELSAVHRAQVALALHEPLLKEIDQMGVTPLLNDVELPLVAVLADMEYNGVRIDTAELAAFSVKLTQRMNAIDAECRELAGQDFNTASPSQVGIILFDVLKLDPKAKKTKTGQYSTTEEVLSHLVDRHPIVEKILELRGVRKLLSTYVNALPELINPATDRIHTTFNQTVTATGRLSSTNPNIQNIPIRDDDGKEIRKAFIPSDGNLFFSADYSQIELRLVADMSGDEAMVNAFLNGDDIHRTTAARIYGVPSEEVTSTQRRNAKTANFGILYGISAFGLAERLRIPRSEAKMLIDGYFQMFPTIKEFMDGNIASAKELGYVTTKMGRRRMLPDINSKNAIVRGFSERNAVNAPIQGTAADIIKIAMVRIYRRFRNEGIRSKMILQVHDELNFDVFPDELEKVQKIVLTEMRGAYQNRVPLDVSAAAGKTWLEAH